MTAERTVVRLFLVDDHPLVRDGLRARLSPLPQIEIVGEAGSAAEALPLIDDLRPDLVLADVGMKEVSGIDMPLRCKSVGRRFAS